MPKLPKLALAAALLSAATAQAAINWQPPKIMGGGWNTHEIAFDSRGGIHLAWSGDGISYRRSLDGGRTWSAIQLVGGPHFWSGNPDIAVDSSGHLFLVYENRAPGRFQLYLRVSRDRGRTWSAPRRIVRSPKNALWPRLLIDSEDRIHVIWHDTFYGHDGGSDDPRVELYHQRSDDGGATWSRRKTIARGEGAWTLGAAVDRDDNLYAIWDFEPRRGDGGAHCYRSGDGGATWSARRIDEGWYPDIAVDRAGDLHAVFLQPLPGQGLGVFHSRSQNRGESWSAPQRLATLRGGSQWNPEGSPVIATGRKRRLYVAYQDSTPGNHEIFFVTSPNGGQRWKKPKRLTRTPEHSLEPSLFYDRKVLHLVWNEVPGRFRLFYRRALIGQAPPRLTGAIRNSIPGGR